MGCRGWGSTSHGEGLRGLGWGLGGVSPAILWTLMSPTGASTGWEEGSSQEGQLNARVWDWDEESPRPRVCCRVRSSAGSSNLQAVLWGEISRDKDPASCIYQSTVLS